MASSANLEDQLRSMILGNVTLSSGQDVQAGKDNRDPPTRGIRRGGRRARFHHDFHNPNHHHRSNSSGVEHPGHSWHPGSRNAPDGVSDVANVQTRPQNDIFHTHTHSHGHYHNRGHNHSHDHGRGHNHGHDHGRGHSHGHGHGRGRGRGHGDSRGRDHSHNGHVEEQVSNNEANHHHSHSRSRGRWTDGGHRGFDRGYGRRAAPSKFVPLHRNSPSYFERQQSQGMFLEKIASTVLPNLEMGPEEWHSKESFRQRLEKLCQDAVQTQLPGDPLAIELVTFGSFSSGYAMPGSDMDLALVSSEMVAHLPRFLEKVLLNAGYGARLLSRTRVPILKICERPSPGLMQALLDEREKWDNMTPEEQESYDKLTVKPKKKAPEGAPATIIDGDGPTPSEAKEANLKSKNNSKRHKSRSKKQDGQGKSDDPALPIAQASAAAQSSIPENNDNNDSNNQNDNNDEDETQNENDNDNNDDDTEATPRSRQQRPWFREKRLGPLDFPKDGVGVQCDINFSTQLGIHNTALLRCYSLCDVRVRLLVLFVKAWAARRKINNSRSGTLSSYGYVLMVLHFLVNVANPPVCPNLQLAQLERDDAANNNPSSTSASSPNPTDNPLATCDGCDIRFLRDETELRTLAARGALTSNPDPLGMLLRQFFQYYAHQHHEAPRGGFAWVRDTLSLRTPGGLLSKATKGWTGARTTTQDNAEVRHRYLFAIEDPFEHEHNVARTVTHHGIVAIRDEFRRAWRLILDAGYGLSSGEGLMDVVADEVPVRGDLRGDRDVEDLKLKVAVDEQDESQRQGQRLMVDGAGEGAQTSTVEW